MNLYTLIDEALTELDLNEVISIQPQACNSFHKLMEIYEQDMVMTDSMKDCLAICLATHIAVTLEGDPLWMYLVGAPSSGKSTICELIASDEIHTRSLSKFTGLVSGSRQGNHLVPLLQGKCVIVKDGTLLLESTPQQLANVFGEMRDIFDGKLDVEYRNGVSASFSNVMFGMVIGITERIYSLNMAALGERFLHCRLETDREIEVIRNKKAISNILTSISRSTLEGNEEGDSRSFPKQRAYTAGFLSHLHSTIRQNDLLRPNHVPSDILFIQALTDVVACSRAEAARSKEFGSSELLYDARPEAGTRVGKQLGKLALCLCYVLGENRITPTIRRLIRKVATDTAYSRQNRIIRTIALSHGLTRSSIAQLTDIPLESITRKIDDLISLGILQAESDKNRPVRGRSVPTLQCTPWIRDAFRKVYNGDTNGQNSRPKPGPKADSKRRTPPQKKRPLPKKKPNSAKR